MRGPAASQRPHRLPARAGKSAEELGQGEAIAVNLREMFSFRVPIISVVIGEGGSGGALAIGCANRCGGGRAGERAGGRAKCCESTS